MATERSSQLCDSRHKERPNTPPKRLHTPVPATATQAVPSGWILSPFWDTVLFIGAPVTCILALFPLRRYWHPQEYSFLLLAFFTFGHHLPGFIRAYGDRELFRRYRLRFLLAPPLIFLTTLWFDQRGLHGLVIFIFAWDIWHVLMQHYGFMRIYDVKRGEISPLTARMDWAISICWYLTLIVASPHYRQNLLFQAYTSGIPLLSSQVFRVLETALYFVTFVVTVSYLGYSLYLWRQGRLAVRKLVLLGTFLAASYYLYVRVDDFIVGFAVWSAFHSVQYYGIVWAYNSNRVARGSAMTRAVRFLFRPRAALVLIYAGLIFAYGGINYLQRFVHDETFRQLLLAFIATSSALHYYYDGFIWKVREKETREFLNIGGITGGLRWVRPAWNQGLVQAAYLAAMIVGLGALETSCPNGELSMRQSLAAVAPQAEESHLQLGETLRRQGRFAGALAEYREAVRLKPAWAQAHVNLGVTLAGLGRIDEAIASYEKALSIDSNIPAAHYNLAVLLASRGERQQAMGHYQKALEGDDPDAQRLARAAIEELRSER
jgi:tetratricopeptide (TPR) repeat protein